MASQAKVEAGEDRLRTRGLSTWLFLTQTVPDVQLTRSRDGSNGVATFTFVKPTIFDNDADVISKGEITGLYLIDEEGELQTQDVVASFVDGKPSRIEARYVMKSAFQWDRFMRFMERYANENSLGFNKA